MFKSFHIFEDIYYIFLRIHKEIKMFKSFHIFEEYIIHLVQECIHKNVNMFLNFDIWIEKYFIHKNASYPYLLSSRIYKKMYDVYLNIPNNFCSIWIFLANFILVILPLTPSLTTSFVTSKNVLIKDRTFFPLNFPFPKPTVRFFLSSCCLLVWTCFSSSLTSFPPLGLPEPF